MGSSRTRARTRVPCIGRLILNHCATREVLKLYFKSQSCLRESRPGAREKLYRLEYASQPQHYWRWGLDRHSVHSRGLSSVPRLHPQVPGAPSPPGMTTKSGFGHLSVLEAEPSPRESCRAAASSSRLFLWIRGPFAGRAQALHPIRHPRTLVSSEKAQQPWAGRSISASLPLFRRTYVTSTTEPDIFHEN